MASLTFSLFIFYIFLGSTTAHFNGIANCNYYFFMKSKDSNEEFLKKLIVESCFRFVNCNIKRSSSFMLNSHQGIISRSIIVPFNPPFDGG